MILQNMFEKTIFHVKKVIVITMTTYIDDHHEGHETNTNVHSTKTYESRRSTRILKPTQR